jgi:hemerythrin
MIWTKEQFGTNVSQHDQEHQTIFRLVNALHESAGQADRSSLAACRAYPPGRIGHRTRSQDA